MKVIFNGVRLRIFLASSTNGMRCPIPGVGIITMRGGFWGSIFLFWRGFEGRIRKGKCWFVL